MSSRLPFLPTLIVAVAIAVMIGLGIWQIRRMDEKEALIARYHAAGALPETAYPTIPTKIEDILFRRAKGFCLEVTGWRVAGAGGGYRQIAECRTGAEGPGLLVDMGISADPNAKPSWRGGTVVGTIAAAPTTDGLMTRLFGRSAPDEPMLISATPAPGLRPSVAPSPDTIPNNHLFYALQWFFFAAAAAVIYVLALRRRQKGGEDIKPE